MASIERMVTDPEASGDYVVGLAKTGVGALAVGSALGLGLWAARNSADTAEEATTEGVEGLAFGGGV